MSSSRMFLDVDSSIVEKNLKITDDTQEEDIVKQLFPETPYTLSKPFPGFCLKLRKTDDNKKLFINVCQLDNLPAPIDIKPEDIYNEDVTFRVPMSIGDLRYQMDKNGEEAVVIDIAINSSFLKKVSSNDILTNFFCDLVKDSIKEKYKISVQDEVVLLKHRKTFGELQMHRIRKQEIDEKMKTQASKQPLITELNKSKYQNKPQIETLANYDQVMESPEFRLFKRKNFPSTLIAEVRLPKVLSSKEFALDVGEDRFVLESIQRNYFLDIFFPIDIDPDQTKANFSKDTKVLTIEMEIKSN